MNIINKVKEVFYHDWCPKCKYQALPENDCPCETCLTYAWNEDSHKPLYFKEKEEDDEEIVRED